MTKQAFMKVVEVEKNFTSAVEAEKKNCNLRIEAAKKNADEMMKAFEVEINELKRIKLNEVYENLTINKTKMENVLKTELTTLDSYFENNLKYAINSLIDIILNF